MRVLVTGATGFIGRALVPVLRRSGHSVTVWTRSEKGARGRLGDDVDIVDAAGGLRAMTAAIERSDAVVNLAGEPILGGRWTAARRAELRQSRVETTALVVAATEAAKKRPAVLVSGSAVGWYGDRGEEVLTEDSPPGDDFLSRLCAEWEEAARRAERLGVRVVLLRTGVVLGRDGGALAQMLPPFRMGAGGPIGSGRQYLPWIHLHDLVGIILAALRDDRYVGPINGVAPAPVRSREFAAALGRALGRPALLPLPAIALRVLFGEGAVVLLASQRAVPAALGDNGFTFEYPSLDAALHQIVSGDPVVVQPVSRTVEPVGGERSRQYLDARRPVYELRATTTVDAPLAETFDFFSKAANLGLLTPSGMRFSISGVPPAIGEDATIEYRLRVGPVPITWRSRIVGWTPRARFVDLQEKGPYRAWWHEHSFRAVGDRTVMEDRVCYAPPLGAIGRLANRFFIAPTLRRIFQYRAEVIRLRFGTQS